jgi:hypothetical protein
MHSHTITNTNPQRHCHVHSLFSPKIIYLTHGAQAAGLYPHCSSLRSPAAAMALIWQITPIPVGPKASIL